MVDWKPKILAVDDEPQNLDLLQQILEEQYELLFAINGLKALEIAQKSQPDMILLDIMMPEMDGFLTCEQLKKDSKTKDIPIVFLTALDDPEYIGKGFKFGAIDYLSKPFNKIELLSRVDTHLTLKKNKEELIELNNHLEKKVKERTLALDESNKKLLIANEELKSLNIAKDEFLKIISHEIRTPLNGIIGFVSLLKDEIQDDDHLEFINLLDHSCKRLEEFSNYALEITNFNSKGSHVLKLEPIDMENSLNNVLDSLNDKVKSNNLTIGKSIAEQVLNADKHYVNICFHIILMNAVQHSPKDSSLFISGKKEENYYSIVIRDEGKGFPDLIVKQGVDAFNSPNHVDKNPGLELYLCQLIVNSHNGSISFKNDDGGIVEMKFPLI